MMGAARNVFLTSDPRHIELVAKIMLKTQLKRIAWQKSATGLTASISGGLQFSFVLSPELFGVMGISPTWQVFTVRRNGEEILKVENAAGFAFLGGPTQLQAAVTKLFDAVKGSASDDLDNAISTVDKI